MKTSPFAAALALLAVLVLGTALASPALAHDALKSSDPAENAKVESLEEVKLTFTARVRFPTVVVRDGDDTPRQDGKAVVDGTVVTQKVEAGLPPGRYVIAYRVVSSDGHPIEGEIPFTLTGSPDASPAESDSPAASAPPAATGSAQSAAPAPAGSAAPTAPAAAATPAAGAADSGGVPGWAWLVFGGMTGIGIGLFLSMRNRKRP
ncbi:copper resistance CopC family protein [Planomonospora sp. ID82291]|uniref:copper resistance CopC family protein n=1 Tax=Planomonospora sp. ID82291 TaxID=2738136 RepID=UPI0018C44B80|nr:copper resistance CopC family protein [Planomonospora sp. ID82291]MBG0816191.1 copper resistance protein CopC [Planomonospora sp. ID82291]